jgi:hypothetical protein
MTWSVERAIVRVSSAAAVAVQGITGYRPCDLIERTLVRVGEALLRRLDHDYDEPLPDDLRRHSSAILTCPCGTTTYVDGSERSVNESAEEFAREHDGHTGPEDAPLLRGYTVDDLTAMKSRIHSNFAGAAASLAHLLPGASVREGKQQDASDPSPSFASAGPHKTSAQVKTTTGACAEPAAPAEWVAAGSGAGEVSATPKPVPSPARSASEEDVGVVNITMRRAEFVPGGGGAFIAYSDDFPDKQFLIVPK